MGTTSTASFDPRRSAGMAPQRRAQEHGIHRTDILVTAAHDANAAGVDRAKSDDAA